MLIKSRYLFIAGLFFLSTSAFTQEGLDKYNEQALQQTQELLRNQKERDAAIQKDSKAKASDAMVKEMFGGDPKAVDGAYNLAAEVFAQVVRESNGDAKKMQELMEKFKRDPATFVNKWSPEQKSKLKELAEKINRPDVKPQK
ncbi:MAG: hypothetical protein K1X29_07480 [Bdellovibrionales bacterium]|nr:hypothetical protein [Bdellovibrionales bacterium]